MTARLEPLRHSRQQLRPAGLRRSRPRIQRVLGWTALGILVVLVTLIATWPATWVARMLAEASHQRVILADATGTIWHGAATVALRAGADSQQATVLPGRLHWRLAPAALLTGRAIVTLTHDTALPAPVHMTVRSDGWQTSAGNLDLPAALLQGIGAPFNTLQPEGRMALSWNPLSGTRDGIIAGSATLRLDQLASNLSPVRPLGSYVAQLQWQNKQGTLHVNTLTGPLFLDGTGTLGRNARFEGTARAAPEAATALNALLSLMGRREGDITRLRF